MIKLLLNALVSFVAMSFAHFLGSEGTAMMSPQKYLLLLFAVFFILIVVYRIQLSKKRKKSWILIVVIYFILFVMANLLRFFLLEKVFAFLGVTTALIFNVSSGSNAGSGNSGGESSLPALESESSSVSLTTYRNVIAAENEAEIYTRIRALENQHYYNLPPQNNLGDYERAVREHFDQAISVDHFLEIFDREYFELRVLERQGLIEDKLQNLMLGERKLERIMELSPYQDVRKEAFTFLKDKVAPVSDLRHAYQRNIMDGSLNSFLQQLTQNGRQSSIYQEFYRYFTDHDFRHLHGLPLP